MPCRWSPARARPGAGQHDEIRHRRAARPGAPGDGPADRRKDWFSEPTSSGDARARGLDRRRALRRTARRRPARGGYPARGKAAFHNSRAPVCQSGLSLCTDPYDNPSGTYVGHDEPSVEFKSDVPGSGNDITYTITLPTEPPKLPRNNGPDGATWNFELRPTFWFGLTLCDTESAPEFTKACAPDSDANDLVGLDPAAPDYIGKHPGNAFMELQFYGPGYVPQFEGFGCDATHYCAAMTIDSLTLDQNTKTPNNPDCDNFVLGGTEPINWAYITHDGHSQAPANPLFTGTFDNPNFAAVNPDLQKDLLMSPGDRVRIHMHDTADGLRIDLTDLTSGGSGSMTASVGNGFGHILYQPDSATCNMAPYAFHPEYSTANPRGNTWSAHTYNVAMSDEIGHFENCRKLDATNTNCAKPGDQDKGALDEDDGNGFCVPAADSTLVKINGCFSDDEDFDGQSYLPTGRERSPTRARTRSSTRRRSSSRARSRTGPRSTRPSRSRPTCRGSRPTTPRTTRRSATGRPARTASTRPGARPSIRSSRPACTPARARSSRAATSSPAPSTTSAAARPPSSGSSSRSRIPTSGRRSPR